MNPEQPADPTPPGSATAKHTVRTGIKRKRLVLSCLECKRRKLKCDRRLPICTRCQEVGHPEQCKYDERLAFGDASEADQPKRAAELAAAPPGTSTPDRPLDILERQRLELLERHVASLESRLNIAPGAAQSAFALTPPSTTKAVTPDHHVSVAEISNDPEEPMVMRGNKFKTQFYGASHSVSIISYFDEVHDFLKKTAREHPLLMNHKNHKKTRKDAMQSKKQPVQTPPIPPAQIDQHLLDTLPDLPRCRALMESYFLHFEGQYRILHRAVFWREFDAFWHKTLDKRAPFAALMLAALACSRCLVPETPLLFDGDTTVSRLEAISWVHAAETWYDYQSRKHTLVKNFQVACLLLLAKRVNAIKLKRQYTIAQTLMATAVSAGLHRSPYLLGPRTSVYDREMRRRIWATIAEQELACSNGRGIPSAMGNIFSDCEPPSNLPDESFDEDTADPPTPLPDTVFTDCSFQRWLHEIRPVRMTINSLVNHPAKHHGLTYSELLSYHTTIAQRQSSLPRWSLRDPADAERRWFMERLCEMALHHLFIILHLPSAADRSSNPNAAHSRFIATESSRQTLAVYEQIPTHGFSGMCVTRHHIVRAGLCICLLQNTPCPTDDTTYSQLLHSQATSLVEKCFSLIEDRILCLGTGFRGFWLLFAASCFLPSHDGAPGGIIEWQKHVTDRIIALFGKVCLYQRNVGVPGYSLEDAADTAELYKRHIQRADWRGDINEPIAAAARQQAAGKKTDGANGAATDGQTDDLDGLGSLALPGEFGWNGDLGDVDWAEWTLDDFGFYSLADA